MACSEVSRDGFWSRKDTEALIQRPPPSCAVICTYPLSSSPVKTCLCQRATQTRRVSIHMWAAVYTSSNRGMIWVLRRKTTARIPRKIASSALPRAPSGPTPISRDRRCISRRWQGLLRNWAFSGQWRITHTHHVNILKLTEFNHPTDSKLKTTNSDEIPPLLGTALD